jgi:hypothetical protein
MAIRLRLIPTVELEPPGTPAPGAPESGASDAERVVRLYRLGHVAELRGDRDAAWAAFQHVLRIDPQHAQARAALDRLQAARQARPLDAAYDILLRNGSAASKEAAAAMQALRFEVRPSLTAYLDRFLLAGSPFGLAVGLWLVAGRLPQSVSAAARVVAALGWTALVLGLVAIATVFAVVRAERIAIDGGRLRLTTALGRRVVNVELWRVRDVRLERRFLDRLTRDGRVVLTIHRGPQATLSELRVVGLARGHRLEQLAERIAELVRLLRASSALNGIASTEY